MMRALPRLTKLLRCIQLFLRGNETWQQSLPSLMGCSAGQSYVSKADYTYTQHCKDVVHLTSAFRATHAC